MQNVSVFLCLVFCNKKWITLNKVVIFGEKIKANSKNEFLFYAFKIKLNGHKEKYNQN